MKKKLLFVSWMAFCVVCSAALGVWYQLDLLEHQRPLFRCLAKLVVLHPAEPYLSHVTKQANPDFYGTCIEVLESAEMIRRARERVYNQNPLLVDHEVEVLCRRSPGSGVINILGSSDDATYPQLFLNALQDEFILYRQDIRDQFGNQQLERLLDQHRGSKEEFEDQNARYERALAESPPDKRGEEVRRLAARLSELRNQRDKANLDSKLAPAPASNPSAVLDPEIESTEKDLKHISGALAELDAASEARTRSKAAYEKASALLAEKVRELEEMHDVVAIQERSSAAAEFVEDPIPRLAITAVSAGITGAIFGLLAVWVLRIKPRVVEPQPDVT